MSIIKKEETFSFIFREKKYGPFKTKKLAAKEYAALLLSLSYNEQQEEIIKLLVQEYVFDTPLIPPVYPSPLPMHPYPTPQWPGWPWPSISYGTTTDDKTSTEAKWKQ
jgi:hypothetical protein